MYYRFRQGFTIVELLVVVAIIAVLTSVVLGSLREARDDSIEAKIKSEMLLLNKRASLEESTTLTFDVVCGSNGVPQSAPMLALINSIETFSGQSIVCNSDTEAYAVSALVASSSYWCVDSLGSSEAVAGHLSTSSPEYACP